MEKGQLFILKDRGIIYLSGEDTRDFLQNIITNDINKVSDTYSCFSSLLSPQGKYLFDFIVVKHKQGYFLDCELNQIDNLINRLSIYKLNSKIEILNLSNEFQVAVISNEKFLSINGSKNEEGYTISYGDDPFFIDPRNKKLGARVIINLEKLYKSIKKLELKPEDPKKYYEISHKIGVAQINTKDLQENIFGLECNLEKLNGIDFKKGCYVGQENTARMKLKNKLKRILLPISFKGKISHLSEITYKEKVVGKILIPEPYPFALFKTVDPEIKELLSGDLFSNRIKLNIVNDRYT